MYCSPPMIRIGSVGASDTFSAGRASALRRPTLSSIPTPALRRCIPSIRITPRFASSGYPRRTPAAVDFVPSMRTMSPSFNSRIFMTSGSMRTIPRPASAGFASATRRNFSRPAAMFSVSPLAARPHARPSRDFATNRRYLNSCRNLETKKRRERSRAASLDRHLDGIRLRGRLLLRNADLEDAVFQRRGGEVGLDLLRKAQHAPEGLVRPLAVLVVLLLLLPGAVRLCADLDPVRGDGEVDILLRNAGSSARTTNSEPLSIRSTRGSRTRRSESVHRVRGPPQKRSSKLRRKLPNHRSMSSNQAKGETVVLARLVGPSLA